MSKYSQPRPAKKYTVMFYLPYEGWNESDSFDTKAEAVAEIQKLVDEGNTPDDFMLIAQLSWSVNIKDSGGKK